MRKCCFFIIPLQNTLVDKIVPHLVIFYHKKLSFFLEKRGPDVIISFVRLRQMDEEYGKMEELNEEQLKQWQERNEEKFHTHNQLIQMTQEEKQKEVEIEGLLSRNMVHCVIFSRRVLTKRARLLQWQVFFFFFVGPQNVCVVDTFSTELLNYWTG